MTTSSQPLNPILSPPATAVYSKRSSSISSSSSSQSSSRPTVPQIIYEDSALLPPASEEDGSVHKQNKKHRTYSDARRRGSSRLTLDEVPELEVLEPEPVWEDDEDDIIKTTEADQRLNDTVVTPYLGQPGAYKGEELRRTTTAPAISRPISLRRERLAPNDGVSWPRVKRLGLGTRSKTHGVDSLARNKLV